MDGLHDGALNDEVLVGFALDGEALSEEAQRHFVQCEVCQRRVARYQKSHASLVSRFYRNQCPTGTRLSFYAVGLLSQEERLRIADHVVDCPLCMADVEETRRYMQTAEFRVPAFDPSALVRRIFATLVKQPEMQLALRGDAPESAWPRQYRAESVNLSLHLSRTSNGEHILLGLLTSINPDENVEALAGVPAELYIAPWSEAAKAKSPPLVRKEVDDIGNVVFNPVSAGEYVMVIHLPGREMIIEGLMIEHS
jgi:hypothetical protein